MLPLLLALLAAPDDQLRTYQLLREQESWAWLREPHQTDDLWDPAKYVELSRKNEVYLTLGGEVREWVEAYRNELWGQTNPSSTSWLQRYMFHLDAHLTPRFRVFVQLKSGLEYGRPDGARPVDEDKLDFNQAFADLNAVPGKVTLRLGRQELSYGSGRLVDVREAPNVRFGHDGARLLIRLDALQADAFVVRPQQTKPGFFDDSTDSGQTFWGSWNSLVLPGLVVDAYYLGLRRGKMAYEKIAGEETRHTVGARVRRKWQSIEAEVEGAYQFGSIAEDRISAWTVAGELLLRAPAPLDPVFTLGFGVTSGDAGSNSSTLGTFNAPFARGAYFGLISANGPSNGFSPHAGAAVSLPARVSLSAEAWAFWRESLDDGVYAVPGFLLRQGNAAQGRYLGEQVEAFATWQADRHLALNATLAYFAGGSFFNANQPGKNTTYSAAWATYTF